MVLTLAHPLSPAMHDGVELLLERALDWLADFVDIEQSGLSTQLARVRIHELAARTAPELELPALDLLHRWYLWLFLNDDLADPLAQGHDPGRLQVVLEPVFAVLDGDGADAGAHPLARMLDDLLTAYRGRGGVWVDRFVRDTRAYLQANVWEARLRSEARVPTLRAYTHLRHDAGAAQTAFDLFPVLDSRYRCAPGGRRHPVLRTLEVLANQHISWVNDILGYEREQAEGNTSNVVAGLAQELGDPGRAVAEAVARCNALMESILETEQDWWALEGGRDPGADRLVEMMLRWTRGSLDWHLRTHRYLERDALEMGATGGPAGRLWIRPELMAMRQRALAG